MQILGAGIWHLSLLIHHLCVNDGGLELATYPYMLIVVVELVVQHHGYLDTGLHSGSVSAGVHFWVLSDGRADFVELCDV